MVVVREDETQTKSQPFPKLMISKTGTIIIALGYAGFSELEGTVIVPGHSEPQGCHSKTLIADRFSDYIGTLTLTNE